MRGVYTLACRARDGRLRWRERAENLITTAGKNAFLDAALAGVDYTANCWLGVIAATGYGAGPALADTMGAHAGWREAGGSTGPASGGRAQAVFTGADAGVVQVVSPTEITFSADGSLQGCFLVFGTGAVGDCDDAGGVLFSAAPFASGPKSVQAGDTLLLTYAAGAPVAQTFGDVLYEAATATDAASASITPATGTTVATLRVNSPSAQVSVPFGDSNGGIFTPIAWVFPKGAVASSVIVVGQPKLHVVPLAHWNDGSLKHCAIVGLWSPSAGDNDITIVSGTPATGTLDPARPDDTVTLGGTSLTLASATLHRTWFSTPDMIERHYRVKTGTRYVWWYVRQWSDAKCWIGRKVENNRSQDVGIGEGAGTDPYTSITGAVSVGSYRATVTHDPNSAFFAESWITGASPGTTYLHDPLALSRTKLVPNWIRRQNGWDENTTNAYASALSTYTPLVGGSHATNWPLGGYKQQLGVLSKWEAVMAKYADARGMAWGKTQALQISTFAVVIRDPVSHNPPKPTEIGMLLNPVSEMAANGGVWDANHGTNSGYVPYLLTGDFRFWETMAQHCAVMVYFLSNDEGFTTSRSMANAEARGVTWIMRTFAQMLAVAPEQMGNAALNAFVTEFRALLAFNVSMWLAAGTQNVPPGGLYTWPTPGNNLGIPGVPPIEKSGETRYIATWMYVGYWTNTFGHLLDIEPLADDTDARAYMQWLGRATVALLSPGGIGAYPWDMAIRDLLGNGNWILGFDANGAYYATWGDLYFANMGAWRTPTNTLQQVQDGISTQISTSYFTAGSWLLHAISACVDYAVPGAAAAFARLTGASNFADFGGDNSWQTEDYFGYGATPTEGVVPRSWRDGRPAAFGFIAVAGSSPSSLLGVPSYAIDDYSGLATDPDTGCIYSVAGSGHAAGEANWVLKCDLTATNPTWEVLKTASGDRYSQSQAYWPDGRPTGAHNYYACHVINVGGRKGLLRVVNMYGAYTGWAPLHTDCFWLDANEWDLNGAGWPTVPADDYDTAMMCMDPRNYRVYSGVRTGQFRWFDPVAKTWVNLRGNGWGMAYGGSVVIPETESVVYDFGAYLKRDGAKVYSGTILNSMSTSGTATHVEHVLDWHTAKPTLFTGDPMAGPDETGMAYDSDEHKIYWMARTALMRVDPFTWACEYLCDVPNAYTAVYNRFGYIPSLRALYYLPRFSAEVMLMRL